MVGLFCRSGYDRDDSMFGSRKHLLRAHCPCTLEQEVGHIGRRENQSSGTKWRSHGCCDEWEVTPAFQDDTLNEDEEAMTGLVHSLGENYLSTLTGKLADDKESEYVKESRPNRVYAEGRLCVQRYKKSNQTTATQGQAGNLETRVATFCQKQWAQSLCHHREATRRDQRRRQIGQGEGNKNAGRDQGQGDDAAKEEVKEVEEEM